MKNTLQKITLTFILVLVFAFSGSAQWTSIAPAYNGMIANDGAVSFAINGLAYLVCGSSTDQVYVYDSLQNQWSVYGTAPVGMGQAFAMSFVIDDKAYIVGGDTGGVPLNTVWEFDPSNSSNPWTQKNNFSPGPRDAAFAFAIGNSGYVGGGFDGMVSLNDIWKYDQPNDSWSQLQASIPINGLIFPSSFVSGNKGYFLLGGTSTGVNETNKMWCIDGSNDSLYTRANFPGAARQAAFAFGNSSYGFAGGGMSGYVNNYLNVWMYDVANDQWSPFADVPLLGAAWSSTFTMGNMGYVGIGAKFVGSGLTGDDHFYKLDMDISTGINSMQNKTNHWSAYPNPATHHVFLNGTFSQDARFRLTDAQGRILSDMKNIPFEKNIDVSELPSGIYTITILENNSVSSNLFVK
jgi:N-acetylneuraminic acid mutarotase